MRARVRSKLTRNVVSKHLTHLGKRAVGNPLAICPENSSMPGAISGCVSGDVFRFENFPARPAHMSARFSGTK
jgi:hypothetical protein